MSFFLRNGKLMRKYLKVWNVLFCFLFVIVLFWFFLVNIFWKFFCLVNFLFNVFGNIFFNVSWRVGLEEFSNWICFERLVKFMYLFLLFEVVCLVLIESFFFILLISLNIWYFVFKGILMYVVFFFLVRSLWYFIRSNVFFKVMFLIFLNFMWFCEILFLLVFIVLVILFLLMNLFYCFWI